MTDRYVFATICYVDTENNVFDAVSADNRQFIRKCQYLKVNPDMSGSIEHPCAGDMCMVRITSDFESHLEKIYTVNSVNSDGIPTFNLGPYSKFMPGDKVWLAKGGSFLQLLRNGLTKIGTSPLCQIIFSRIENLSRWVSRNVEILTSGFRFYSVNTDGKNVTRLSIFLQDAMSNILRNTSSEASDFEFVADKEALTCFYGMKGKDGNRINLGQVSIDTKGNLIFLTFDKTDPTITTRRIQYTQSGSLHIEYDNKNNPIYEKVISRVKEHFNQNSEHYMVPKIIVNEHIAGDYNLIVDGNCKLTAGQDLRTNAHDLYAYAENQNTIKSLIHNVQADVRV